MQNQAEHVNAGQARPGSASLSLDFALLLLSRSPSLAVNILSVKLTFHDAHCTKLEDCNLHGMCSILQKLLRSLSLSI